MLNPRHSLTQFSWPPPSQSRHQPAPRTVFSSGIRRIRAAATTGSTTTVINEASKTAGTTPAIADRPTIRVTTNIARPIAPTAGSTREYSGTGMSPVTTTAIAVTRATTETAGRRGFPGPDFGRGPSIRDGRFRSPASENGYRDGYAQGRDDARDGDRHDPVRASRYRSGDHDYNGRYGSRDDYKREYRAAFVQGYEQGYRESRRR